MKRLIILLNIISIPYLSISQEDNNLCYIFSHAMNKESDTIGKYDINVFVIGVVRIDSLTVIQKYKASSKEVSEQLFTYFNNITSIVEQDSDFSDLIYTKNCFDIENDKYFIDYFVYPRCSDNLKNVLNITYHEFGIDNMCRIEIQYGNERYLTKKIKCKTLVNTNYYILLLMNKSWRESRLNFMYDKTFPSKKTSDKYIKYLIPIYFQD